MIKPRPSPLLLRLVLSVLLVATPGLPGWFAQPAGAGPAAKGRDLRKGESALLAHGVETEEIVRKVPTPWTPDLAAAAAGLTGPGVAAMRLPWIAVESARPTRFDAGIGRGRAPPLLMAAVLRA